MACITFTDLTDMDLLTRVKSSISEGLEYIANLVSYRMSYSYFRTLINNLFLGLGIKVKIIPIRSVVNGRKKIVKAKVIPL